MMCRARARLHGRSSERARLRQTDLTRALVIMCMCVYTPGTMMLKLLRPLNTAHLCVCVCVWVCVGVTHTVCHTHTSDCNTRNVRHIFLPSLSHTTITKHTRHDRKTWHLGLCMLQFATFTTQIACVVIVVCIELHCVYICVCSRTPFTRTHVVRFGRF